MAARTTRDALTQGLTHHDNGQPPTVTVQSSPSRAMTARGLATTNPDGTLTLTTRGLYRARRLRDAGHTPDPRAVVADRIKTELAPVKHCKVTHVNGVYRVRLQYPTQEAAEAGLVEVLAILHALPWVSDVVGEVRASRGRRFFYPFVTLTARPD